MAARTIGTLDAGTRPGATELALLRCARCGSPLAARDAPSLRCAACGEETVIPSAHRAAVRLTQQADAELQRAAGAWRRLERATLSRGRTLALTHLPALLLSLGVGWLAAFQVEVAALSDAATAGVLSVLFVLPLSMRAAVLAAFYGMPVEKLDALAASLAARGGAHECRWCGAPLDVPPRAVFVRCIYCRTDNLVVADALQRAAHSKEIADARKHSTRTQALADLRVREAESTTTGGVVLAGVASTLGFVACFVPRESLGRLVPFLAVAFFAGCFAAELYAWFVASSPHIFRKLGGTLQEALATGAGGRGARSRPAVELLTWGIAVALLQALAWLLFLFTDVPRIAAWLAAASVVPVIGWILRAWTRWDDVPMRTPRA